LPPSFIFDPREVLLALLLCLSLPRALRLSFSLSLSLFRSLRRALPGSMLPGTTLVCPALEATQGRLDILNIQLPYKCHLEEVASVGD
jgi:hypothetical protein